MALGASMGPGGLGHLYVTLSANSTALVSGMRGAEGVVATSSTRMLAQAKVLSLGLTGAFAAIGAAAVYQFSRFDKAMTQSLAIMGDVNQNMRDEMAQTARQLATTSTTSAEKLAEAYFFLASAGLNAQQSIKALATVDAFAIAGQFDMARATDLLTDAQSALGLTVKDTTQNMVNMTRISDVLVKANNLANATVEQFSTSLTTEAGAALRSFNIDMEEGLAVLAAFADQGVKGEKAGSGLARVLRLVTSAAVKNADAYREMNVQVFDAQGNINNLGDIIGDLEEAFKGMSDEQRVAALETLGFRAMVQGVVLPLLGTSEKIRGYEAELRKAGGTTKEVADKQLKNFIDQLTITWHRIEEILLQIGEQLTPTLEALNVMLQEVTGSADDMQDSFGGFMQTVGPAFVAVVGTIGDVVWGLKLAFNALKVGVYATLKVIIKGIDLFVNAAAGSINVVLRGFNKLPGVKIPLVTVTSSVEALTQALDELGGESADTIKKLVDEGSFSERLLKGYEKATAGIKIENDEIVEDVKETVKEVENQFTKVSRSIATQDINEMFTRAFGENGVPGRLEAPVVGDAATFEIQRLREQQTLAEENLQILEEIHNSEIELTAETQEKKLALMEAYNEQVKALQAAQAQIILGSSTQMFSDLAGIAAGFVGEQSGIYKGLFAMSKAFAIAEATVKIAQGIASAASLPFPANIPAMASVIAATSSIISSIQSVQLTFGGERQYGGSVSSGSAYLVGEAGPELFAPGQSGRIIPNDNLGGGTQVIIQNYTNAKAEVRETETSDGKTVEVIIGRVKNELASEVREGRGAFTRSIQSAYGLNRKGS